MGLKLAVAAVTAWGGMPREGGGGDCKGVLGGLIVVVSGMIDDPLLTTSQSVMTTVTGSSQHEATGG